MTTVVKPKKKSRLAKGLLAKRQWFTGYMFMLPWIVGFMLFTAWPFFETVYLSFFNVSQTSLGRELYFVGWDNYHLALLRRTDFAPALVTFLWMQIVYTPVITVISFILALLLNASIKARGFFRALFFFPVVVMSGPVVYQLLDAGGMGSIVIHNFLLYNMIFQYSPILANAIFFLFSHYTMMLWFTGIPIILMINALQKIDSGIIEAARIDSATNWQILWKITIPIIRPIFLVSIILTIIQLSGNTLNPVLPIIVTQMGVTLGGLGIASAFTWIYSLLILLLIGFAFLFLKGPKDVVPADVKRRKVAWKDR